MAYRNYTVDKLFDFVSYPNVCERILYFSTTLSRARKLRSEYGEACRILKINGLYALTFDIDFLKCAIDLYNKGQLKDIPGTIMPKEDLLK